MMITAIARDMTAVFVALAAAFLAQAQPTLDPEAEAAEIASVYESWRPLAESMERVAALDDLDRDIARRVAGEPPFPADLAMHLEMRREARREALRRAVEAHDPVALIERAPQTANFLTRLVRADIDPELTAALMARFEPLAGTPALHPMVYDSLVQPRARAPGPAAAARSDDPASLARFEAEIGVHEDLAAELGAAVGRDQFVRAVFVPKLAAFGAEAGPFIAAFSPVIEAEDAQNTARAAATLEHPGFAVLHAEAPSTARRVVDLLHHGASLDQRRALLATIEPLALAGEFDGQQYALMYDRLAEAEGRPQRYGSQDACVDGRREIYTLEDEANVDDRRAQMGLGPLEAYRSLLIDQYGPAC